MRRLRHLLRHDGESSAGQGGRPAGRHGRERHSIGDDGDDRRPGPVAATRRERRDRRPAQADGRRARGGHEEAPGRVRGPRAGAGKRGVGAVDDCGEEPRMHRQGREHADPRSAGVRAAAEQAGTGGYGHARLRRREHDGHGGRRRPGDRLHDGTRQPCRLPGRACDQDRVELGDLRADERTTSTSTPARCSPGRRWTTSARRYCRCCCASVAARRRRRRSTARTPSPSLRRTRRCSQGSSIRSIPTVRREARVSARDP